MLLCWRKVGAVTCQLMCLDVAMPVKFLPMRWEHLIPGGVSAVRFCLLFGRWDCTRGPCLHPLISLGVCVCPPWARWLCQGSEALMRVGQTLMAAHMLRSGLMLLPLGKDLALWSLVWWGQTQASPEPEALCSPPSLPFHLGGNLSSETLRSKKYGFPLFSRMKINIECTRLLH